MIITGVRTLTKALAAPALSSAISGSTATLAWTPPTPTGQSVIAGYRVYRSTTLGGTYTQIGGSLPPTQLSLTDTLSATQFYKVEAFDQFVTGGRSGGVQCVPSTGQRIKFNGSCAYWQIDYNISLSSQFARMAALKAACPATRGFEVSWNWALLENPALVGGTAQYDGSWNFANDQTNINNLRGFALWDKFLAEAARLGCQLMVSIRLVGGHSNPGAQSATNFPTSFVPSYWRNSTYGPNTASTNGVWGAAWINCFTTNNGSQFSWYFRWWDSAVAPLIKAFANAYGPRYNANPNLETVSWSSDELIADVATGISDAGALATTTGANGIMQVWRAAFPNTQVRMFISYVANTPATMDTWLADAVSRDISIGGPDTCNDSPYTSTDPVLNSDTHYRSVTAVWRWKGLTASKGNGGTQDPTAPVYAGQGHYICEVEGEDLAYDAFDGSVYSGDGRFLGDGVLQHIVAEANLLGATHMVWYDNTAVTGRPAHPPLSSRVATNGAHPNLCDYVQSVATGGGDVNGVAAGITLTNTTYPPTFPQ
jgi:hypothetical protein